MQWLCYQNKTKKVHFHVCSLFFVFSCSICLMSVLLLLNLFDVSSSPAQFVWCQFFSCSICLMPVLLLLNLFDVSSKVLGARGITLTPTIPNCSGTSSSMSLQGQSAAVSWNFFDLFWINIEHILDSWNFFDLLRINIEDVLVRWKAVDVLWINTEGLSSQPDLLKLPWFVPN